MVRKVLLAGLAVIAAAVVALALLIRIFITPDAVKSFVTSKAGNVLNRKVDIGEIRISLLKGITIKDFSIKEKDEKSDFVTCKDFVLKYRLLPLLSKKLIIEELRFVSPEVRIRRTAENRFNFEDIGREEGREGVKEEMKDEGAGGLPVSLLIDSVVIENAVFLFSEHRAVFNGTLALKEKEIVIDMEARSGTSVAEISGTIGNYLKNPEVKLGIHSKQLSLDDVIPASSADKGKKGEKEEKARGRDSGEAKPQRLSLSAEGEITIDSLQYGDLTMKDLAARVRFKNNTFEIAEMSVLVGKGRCTMNGSVDLSVPGYTYAVNGSLDSVHAEEVFGSFFPGGRDTFSGVLSFNLDLDGAGTLPENIKKNLKGKGDFSMRNGKITNSRLPENLSLFLGIDEFRTLSLEQARGTVTFGKGTVKLESIFSSGDFSMDPTGTIGFDKTLDLAFHLRLSPRLTDRAMMRSGISSYIKDDEGWGRIPLRVSGTLSDPSYRVDVEKAGKQVIKKKAQELLRDLLEKDSRKRGNTGEMQIQDLLKGF